MISPQKDFDSAQCDSDEQEEQKMTRVISRTPSQQEFDEEETFTRNRRFKDSEEEDLEKECGNDGENLQEDEDSDDFVDAFDNEKDLAYFQKKTEKDDDENVGKGELRRTASYSNLIIQEDVKGEDEDDDKLRPDQKSKNNSPNKVEFSKFGINNAGLKKSNGRGEKSYFDAGSVRNTAYDEEFFNYFQQLLTEVIQKLKKQGCNVDHNQAEALVGRY